MPLGTAVDLGSGDIVLDVLLYVGHSYVLCTLID